MTKVTEQVFRWCKRHRLVFGCIVVASALSYLTLYLLFGGEIVQVIGVGYMVVVVSSHVGAHYVA